MRHETIRIVLFTTDTIKSEKTIHCWESRFAPLIGDMIKTGDYEYIVSDRRWNLDHNELALYCKKVVN